MDGGELQKVPSSGLGADRGFRGAPPPLVRRHLNTAPGHLVDHHRHWPAIQGPEEMSPNKSVQVINHETSFNCLLLNQGSEEENAVLLFLEEDGETESVLYDAKKILKIKCKS